MDEPKAQRLMVSVSYQAADLKRRKKKLEEEEHEFDRQIEVGHIYEDVHLVKHLSTPYVST